MKLTISKEKLIHGLQSVQNVVSGRSTMPILSNVLLRALDGKLEFIATDLDLTISCMVEAEIETAGSTTLPAKKLLEIVRELPTLQVEMLVDDKHFCRIVSGSAYCKLHGQPAEEFPPFPKTEEGRKLTLQQEQFRGLLKKTSFATSTDESRFVLNGVFLSVKTDAVIMVATDGRRLAMAEVEVETPSGSAGDAILPSKAVNELNRLVGLAGNIEMRFGANQAAFVLTPEKGMPTILVSKLVEGVYPNYRQVIPGEAKIRISLSREELYQALRRADIMTSDKSKSVKLSFTENRLEITANSPEVGEARETIAVNYSGDPIAVAFNPVYLMDPLKALDNDEVFVELIDELSPGVLKTTTPFLYVIMPMRMS